MVGPGRLPRPPVMRYAVKPVTVEACDCDDCRAGSHLYELFRWRDGQWQWVGISLQTYASAEECQRQHFWGVHFGPDDVWEDGTPIKEPEPRHPATPGEGKLNTTALRKSAEALKRHWPSGSAAREFILNLPDLPHPDAIRRFILTNLPPAPQDDDDHLPS